MPEASAAEPGGLIVRRVRDRDPQAPPGQDELFPVCRYHAFFTGTPVKMIQAGQQHRGHAVIGQVFAGWNDGPLARLPSGRSAAGAAWLSIAAIAYSLMRAAGALASRDHARARAAAIGRDLIAIAARTARHGHGHLTLRLPACWHRRYQWLNLYAAACGPPATPA